MIKKFFCYLMSLLMTLTLISVPVNVFAASDTTDTYAAEMLGYYKAYQDDAATDVERLLANITSVNETKGKLWSDFMETWKQVKESSYVNVAARNTEGNITKDELPVSLLKENSNIQDDNTVAIVVLGQGLEKDSNGKPVMKDELVGRVQVGLALANEYPNAYVLVTGGDVQKVGVTEADAMADWFIDQELDEGRLIKETNASNTITNATKSYDLLKEENITSIILVTSDYHIQRGSMCFNSAILKDALNTGAASMKIVANCGYDTEKSYEAFSQQADAIKSITGITPSSNPKLSELESLLVTQESVYVIGEDLNIVVKANYDTKYTRDVTEFVTITGFDESSDSSQTVTISYTENGRTLTGTFTLSETSKLIEDNRAKLEVLLGEAEQLSNVVYTSATQEVFDYALNNARTTLDNVNSTDNEIRSAYLALNSAINGLEERENVALNKSAIANYPDADKRPITNITDGDITNYWAVQDNNQNVPIENTHFIVDLNGTYALDTINVIPYYLKNDRYYQYDVYLSTDKENWTPVAEYRGTDYTTKKGQVFELKTPVNARYIKVQGIDVYAEGRDDINNFHVCELRAYGKFVPEIIEEETRSENLALYGKVTVDSNINDNSKGKEYLLTDGKIENTYSTSENGVANAFVMVELPGVSKVKEINVVTYYGTTNGQKWYTYDVLVSKDGTEWTLVGGHSEKKYVGSEGYTITLDQAVEARYVKVQGKDTDNNDRLHVVEVRVYGTCENIALNKPTTASGSGNNRDPKYAVDGILTNDNYWAFDPGVVLENLSESERPYLIVDLEKVYVLDTVNVLNYRGSRYYHFNIYTSVDGVDFTLFRSKTDDTVSYFSTSIRSSQTVKARYIKIVGTKNSADPYKAFHVNEVRVFGTLYQEPDANYSVVDEAKNSIPTDLTLYTADTVTNLKLALAAVKTGLKESQQDKVDAYAAAIIAAKEALVYKDADYSAVNAAIAAANALNKDHYVKFTAVETAIKAVKTGKNITEQSDVDAMAKAITDAIKALEYKPADYSKVETALAKVPSETSLYTEETVANLNSAVASIIRGKDIREQNVVDGYAGAIEAAVLALQYKDADYTKINEAKSKIPGDLNVYTDETVEALQDAVALIKEGLDITKQAEVNAVVKAIEDAIAALKYKPADYSAVNAAIAAANALNKDYYVDFTDVENAVKAVDTSKNITEQSDVDAMAKAIKDAIDALVYKPADYSKVEEMKASIPSDLSLYTEESVAALNIVLEGVDTGKNITEQSEVDAYVGIIEAAILKLELKDADYTEVNEAKSKIPYDLSLYTEESVNVLREAIAAIKEDLDITDQEEVKAMAEAILRAVDALELKPVYDFTEGADSVYTINEDGSHTFKCTGPFDKFEKLNLYFGEKEITIKEDDVEIKEGSTVVIFTKDFMNALEEGEYRLVLSYKGNITAECRFNVEKASSAISPSEPTAPQTPTVPSTGDSSNPLAYGVLALLSLLGIVVLKKKNFVGR